MVHYTLEGNHLGLKNKLDLLEETHLTTTIRNKVCQCKIIRYHTVRIKNIIFKLRDVVLRKLEAANNRESIGKLVLKWNSPFKITRIIKVNTYDLQDTKGKGLPHA